MTTTGEAPSPAAKLEKEFRELRTSGGGPSALQHSNTLAKVINGSCEMTILKAFSNVSWCSFLSAHVSIHGYSVRSSILSPGTRPKSRRLRVNTVRLRDRAMAASRNRVARGCGPKSAHDCGQLQARCQASTASTRASSGQARSRSETVTSSIGHGIASPGSSQRMPCSYSGAYSSVVL